MRYCSLSISRRIYVGTGKRSLFHLMVHWIFDSQFSWRSPTLQNCIHRLFQLLGGLFHVFVTEPRIFVSWASQRVLLQLLVDTKLTQCVKSRMYPELLHPMWGIVHLWHKCLASHFLCCSHGDFRCMAIRLTIDCRVIILFALRFPCWSSMESYKTDWSRCLGCIDNVISANRFGYFIMRDMNFKYNNDYPGLSLFNNFVHNCACKDISFCDDLLSQY